MEVWSENCCQSSYFSLLRLQVLSPWLGDIKIISLGEIMDCACTIFLAKKHGDLCDFCRREVIFKSSGKLLKTFRRVEIHFYYTCI